MNKRPRLKPPKLIRQDELTRLICEQFGITGQAVRQWIKKGIIPKPHTVLSQKSKFWRRADIEAWMETHS